MKINEIFYSIQGEGPSAGQPAVFIRFQGCNLMCSFCDSKYTWNGYYNEMDVEEIVEKVMIEIEDDKRELTSYRNILVVFTGGEPMLYQEDLEKCIKHLARKNFKSFEIETNGTRTPKPSAVFGRDDVRFIISPKLDEMEQENVEIAEFQQPRTLKFVVDDANDCERVMDWYIDTTVREEEIYFMPQGRCEVEIEKRQGEIVEMCKRFGVKYSPRLQIDIYGDERGR